MTTTPRVRKTTDQAGRASTTPRARKAASTPRAPGAAAKASSAPAAVPALALRPKAAKLVRDSFTIPKNEYLVLTSLKDRAAQLKRPTKKSELLRAGVAALGAMSDRAFLAALGKVPSLKTGRPKEEAAAAPRR